jgi:thiamine biosynthesis protein ThiS
LGSVSFLFSGNAGKENAMLVCVNGETCETQAVYVADLIRDHVADPARVAVILNDAVLPAAMRATTRLADGDCVELLAFAGGG